MTKYLTSQGITDIKIGQTRKQIAEVHQRQPIDWYVYSSALPKDHPEIVFCQENNIKTSKRDEFLNKVISDKQLKLVAIAGTHGKTTTTAMTIWALKQLDVPISYSLGAKISFGDMGHFEPGGQYFVYEADEFDRNFLAFHPFYSIIPGVAYDHHEIFPTEQDYLQAFRQFLNQSQRAILWQDDLQKLGISEAEEKYTLASYSDEGIDQIRLTGLYNRRDAWLVVKAVSQLTGERPEKLIQILSQFPGVSRRFERIIDNLYSDDAHTPEKIQGCMSVAGELAAKTGQKIIVVYEPLTNRRMHYLGAAHHSVFDGAAAIYWVPSYLAREDPSLPVLSPDELIKNLNPELQTIAKPMDRDEELKTAIKQHLQAGDMVVAMSGGGAGSLDEWLRQQFAS
jgi:UDP-N-acetylmuramate--alanine ligase